MTAALRYRRAVASIALAVVVLGSGGCGSTPPAEQYLDARTGATIFRIDDPFLLYRRVPRFATRDATEFLLLAPFEVNRAGDYRLYLWLEVSDLSLEDSMLREALRSVVLEVDDRSETLELETFERRELGIGDHVYERHAGWGTSAYYRVDAGLVDDIAAASRLAVTLAADDEPFALADIGPARGEAIRELRALSSGQR